MAGIALRTGLGAQVAPQHLIWREGYGGPNMSGSDPKCLALESRSNESVTVELRQVRERHYLMPFSE